MPRQALFHLAGLLVLLGLFAPVGHARQAPPGGNDLARMQALEQTPLTEADKQLFLLDGVIWLRRRGDTRFRQGEATTDVAADLEQQRALLREQALTDATPYDLVLDLGDAAERAFVEGLVGVVQATERAGFYRATLTKAQTVPVAERGIAMTRYPSFPGDGVVEPDGDARAQAAKATAGQAALATEVIFAEDFEGAFPGAWTTGDDNASSGLDYWGDVSGGLCTAHAGSWSAWSADEGDQPDCVTYDNFMDAFMYNTEAIEVGRYDDVMLSYWLWHLTEPGFDFFRRYDSPDGVVWTLVDEFDGNSVGWTQQTSSLVGFTDYYVKFVFFSDESIVFEGAYLDDISVTGNQLFAENAAGPLTGVSGSSAAWGDYDNDGDLDLVLTGFSTVFGRVSKVYESDGFGAFTEHTTLTGVSSGSVAWGDYDNDGDLDLVLTGIGASLSPVSEVYDNDGMGIFTLNPTISSTLTSVRNSSVAWGDYDNDGDLDLVLTGLDASLNPVSEVYDNDGAGGFARNTAISGTLTDVSSSSVAWGDYDNDGDLDLVLAGSTGSTRVSEVYDNDGVGGFTKNTAISSTLTDVDDGSVVWGDYDNDADLDLVLTGSTGSTRVGEVYDNNGPGGFAKNTAISAILTDVRFSSAAWGDYDNDGDLDLLLTGSTGSARVSEVYDNDGAGSVTRNASIGNTLTDVEDGSVAWGDYDNDGDLDILLTGFTGSVGVSEVYDNVGGFPANTPPAPPTVLVTEPTDVSATLLWNAATDTETPIYGLAYTLRIGTTPGGFDVMAPMSIVNTSTGAGKSATCSPTCPSGWRKMAALPPVRPVLVSGYPSWTIEGLLPGQTYYWSVQAIDGAFSGSAFADESSFTTAPYTKNTALSSILADVSQSSVAWGDYDNDGDLDLLITGCLDSSCAPPVSEVYDNDGVGGFAKNIALSNVITGVSSGSVAWGDYDNDGDLDILLTGFSSSSPFFVSEVYDNDGVGGFAKNTAISGTLTGVDRSKAAWGDYDNDGDLDILLTGCPDVVCTPPVSEVYDNDGAGGFVKNTAISSTLTDVHDGSVAWGDYDNDGDLDLLLTGYDGSNPVSEVYDNDGMGGLARNATISSTLTDVRFSSAVWGDYDNDSDLDILLTGFSSPVEFSEIYDNDGVGGFTKNTTISNTLKNVWASAVAWGDYDNDGDLDILLTGRDIPAAVSEVYDNDGVGGFAKNSIINRTLTSIAIGSVAWVDYDNDGDLDILLTGEDPYASWTPVSEVYDNVGDFPVNTAPTPPTGLGSASTDVAATLSWNAATDAQTPTDGLAYTLRIGTTPGGFDVMAPMSVVNTTTGAGKSAACSPSCPLGLRKIVALPPVRPLAGIPRPSWAVKGLMPNTTYYWSVQAIDGAYAGGAFAAEGVLTTSPLTNNTTISSVLTGVHFGSAAWGDYDNDGDLDILLTGRDSFDISVSAVYDNNGDGTFSKNTTISSVLTDVVAGSVAWGDYDNDGDLDILLTGFGTAGRVSEVYDNDGVGGFAKNNGISSTLTDVHISSAVWGDYDNDGDLDILLTGQNNSLGRVSEVYDNDGMGGFAKNIPVSNSLPDVFDGSAAWGDYDNDGDLDILLTGGAVSGRVSEVYDNDGAGGFAKNTAISATLTDVWQGPVAWGDYDNDGDLDILLTGENASLIKISEVYDNDGVGGFTKNTTISNILIGVNFGSVAWGDYDNDGDLDLMLTGSTGSVGVSEVYDNDGVGGFTKNAEISSTLTGVRDSSAAWGDYDNDGDLDLLLAGLDASDNPVSAVYDNVGTFPANTPPTAPAGLGAAPTATTALLSWNAATDAQTPVDGLAYTLRIGTTAGGFDVMAPMSVVNTTTGSGKTAACSPGPCPSGLRKIVALPPVRPRAGGERPSWQVEGLVPNQTYYWSVQALDGGYAGGAFAAQRSFVTPGIRYVAPTGTDTGNDCSNAFNPCATVGHAVSQALAGDTINLAAGTYTEPGLVIDKAVYIQGAGVLVQ